jgi:D-xylose transport system substrate-binding protein
MTVYKAVKKESDAASALAIALVKGQPISTNAALADGPGKTVKAILETPVPVTTANIESTVVKDGFLTPAEICTGVYAQYCTKYGIH